LLVNESHIVGALLMGDQTWSRPLQKLIVEQVDISPVRAALVGGGGDALDQLANYYHRWERSRTTRVPQP